MFCQLGAKDNEMLDDLKGEGFTITPPGFDRIRKKPELKRLEASVEQREHMDQVTRNLIEQELG